MALTIRDVQSCGGAGAGAPTSALAMGAFASDPVNGDVIIVGSSVYTDAAGGQAPTDSAGNTYVRVGTAVLQSVGNPNTGLALWAAYNITGGSSFVVTDHTKNNAHAAVAWCLTGADASPYNGDWVEAHGATTSPQVVGPSTPSPAANSIMLGFHMQDASANTPTYTAGWNTTGVNGFDAGMLGRSHNSYAGVPITLFSAYLLTSTVETLTWTCVISFDWAGMLASFKPFAVPVAGGANALFFAT